MNDALNRRAIRLNRTVPEGRKGEDWLIGEVNVVRGFATRLVGVPLKKPIRKLQAPLATLPGASIGGGGFHRLDAGVDGGVFRGLAFGEERNQSPAHVAALIRSVQFPNDYQHRPTLARPLVPDTSYPVVRESEYCISMAAASRKPLKRVSAKKKTARPRTRKTVPAVAFVESMECLGVSKIPEGPAWSYEIKLDGYRLEAVKNAGVMRLYSRRRNDLTDKYPYIAQAFEDLPGGSIVDGELVAIGDDGHASFGMLQNFKSESERIRYVAFDLLALKGKSLIGKPLSKRRELLAEALPKHPRLSLSAYSPTLKQMMPFAKTHGLEGIIAKQSEGRYEPGKRSGAWQKHRFNRGQEFVVGGYTKGTTPFDAIIIGFYEKGALLYASRVRAGFVPASRRELFKLMKGLEQKQCPFANLPEKSEGRWGQGLTAEKMKNCVWLKPEIVVQVEFLEWTDATHLRHPIYVAIRDDKTAEKVRREAS
jgi:DNA ligase D-like protein (predicted ligase)